MTFQLVLYMEMVMTLKSFPLAMAIASLALFGCDDKSDEGVGTATGTAGTATGGATGGGGGGGGGNPDSGGGGGGGGNSGVMPTGFGMQEAHFAFDPIEGMVRSFFFSDGTEQVPYYVLNAYDSRGDGCVVIVEAPGDVEPMRDGWVDSQGLYIGWEMPGGATITSDCADVLGDDNWIALMEGVPTEDTIGIGVGEMTEDGVTYSAAYISDWADVADNAVGIGWYWSALSDGYTWAPDGYLADSTGFAYEVDDDYNLLVDDSSYLIFLAGEDIPDAGAGISQAYYRQFVSWNGIQITF